MVIISKEEMALLNKYFNAANYLSVGQLYLKDNPLLERPLNLDDIKYKLVGHWGTVPTQNFIWTHLNRMIVKYDLVVIAKLLILILKEVILKYIQILQWIKMV